MANGVHRQWDFQKIIRTFIKEEVKTPLSFFFKVVPYMTGAWVAILYAPGVPGDMKFAIVRFSAYVFAGLCLLVALFAFIRPRHLVYGEAGHRAERKMEMGTETRHFTHEEFEDMLPESNVDRQQLPPGDKGEQAPPPKEDQ